MPHYLIQGSYTAEGCQGLIAEGATVRLEEASSLIAALGARWSRCTTSGEPMT